MSEFRPQDLPEPELDARWLADALRSVQAPGSGLLWFGIVSIFIAVVVLVILLVSPDSVYKPYHDHLLKTQKEQIEAGHPPVPVPPYKQFVDSNLKFQLVEAIVAIGGSVVIVIGGMKMKQMSGYGWAVVGALLAAIPCTNCFCCAGLPVGMWALVTLFGSDVRLGFSRISAAGGLEQYMTEMENQGPTKLPPV